MTNMEEKTGPKLLPKKQTTERTSKYKLKLLFQVLPTHFYLQFVFCEHVK